MGLLLGAFGGASLLGAVIYGIIGPRLPRRLTFGIAFVIVGLPFWILTLSPPFPIALTALAVTGLAAGPLNPIIQTVMFERVPRQMRGRVMGALTSAAYVAMPLGMLLAGFISERFGVISAVNLVAAGYMLITPRRSSTRPCARWTGRAAPLRPPFRRSRSQAGRQCRQLGVAARTRKGGYPFRSAGGSSEDDEHLSIDVRGRRHENASPAGAPV